jgi:hypothetical protein
MLRHLFRSSKPNILGSTKPVVTWESNPTNIESPVFSGNAAITRIPQKTLRDPILPMFSLYLSDVGVWDWDENSLNFSESGWWGRILSEMKILIPIVIGLLVVGGRK